MTGTETNNKYWKGRKINWDTHYWSPNHAHRDMIIDALKKVNLKSVLEIGCGAGANLHRIKQAFPNVDISGCDINVDAIAMAKKKLPDADLKVGSILDLPFNGEFYDLILTDAMLIYIGPEKIRRAFREIRRVGYEKMMFVEFHSESWLKRKALSLTSRYNAYDYKKLLKKYYFKSVRVRKIPKEVWNGEPWLTYGNIITALR